MSDVPQETLDFWLDIVKPDGEWDHDQVWRELHDYRLLLHNVPLVYDHVTGGRVSKPNTVASDVIGESDDHFDRLRTEEREDEFVEITLVPVEVFGTNENFGYGLCDAVSAWSDCNRAVGRIYRVDDTEEPTYRLPGETVTIFVKHDDLPWFEQKWGDKAEPGDCPLCLEGKHPEPLCPNQRRPT